MHTFFGILINYLIYQINYLINMHGVNLQINILFRMPPYPWVSLTEDVQNANKLHPFIMFLALLQVHSLSMVKLSIACFIFVSWCNLSPGVLLLVISCVVCNCCWLDVCIVVVVLYVLLAYVYLCTMWALLFFFFYFRCRTAG